MGPKEALGPRTPNRSGWEGKKSVSVFGVIRNLTIAAFVALALVAVAANIKLPVGYRVLVVQSGSMEPAIPVGSVLLTKPTADFAAPMPNARFLKGDVITYANGKNNFVSHRVVGVQEKDGQFFYQTKGDANKTADQNLIAENEVVGKSIFAVPYLGRFVNFAKTPLGYFLMIIIPSLYVILSEAWAIISEIRKSRTKIPSAGFALPLALIFVTSIYFVGGTAAYFFDTANSTNNVFTAAPVFTNHLVINEVMFNPPNTNACGNEGDAEWVEIYNPTSSPVNLDTWSVGDGNSTDDLPNVSLPAGGFAVVSDCTQSNFTSIWTLPGGAVYIDLSSTIGNGLNNGGEHMRLFNVTTLIDDMSYGSNTTAFSPSVPAPVTNHSIERDPDGVDTNTAADFVDRTTPQPGL